MAGMRKEIKSPSALLHAYACQAHIMNLIAKDMFQDSKYVVNKVVSVSKHLRNHHAEAAEMKFLKIPRPPIPCETRWNSVGDAQEYFDNHCSNIVIIFNKTLKSSDQIYGFKENVQLKRCVTVLLQMFSPVNRAVDRLQINSSTLGLVFKVWNELRSNTPGQYMQHVSKR